MRNGSRALSTRGTNLCATLLLHFSDVRNVFDVIQQCENGGRTKYCGFDISTQYLGVHCSENCLIFYNLKSHGWDKQVMWRVSRSRGLDKEIPHGVLPMEQLVLSDKWARNRNTSFATPVKEMDIQSKSNRDIIR